MIAQALRTRIARNLQTVRERIDQALVRSGRAGQAVRLVAVTKSADLEAIRAMVELGQTDLGESRVAQMVERAQQLQQAGCAGGVAWHMVGHLQRNKARVALDVAAMIHSVDSLRLAEEIDHRCEQMGRRVDVLMQVNCSGEAQKFGVAMGAAMPLAELISTLGDLNVVGLMTMGPLEGGPDAARRAFARLRELFEEMRHEKIVSGEFEHLSMGMSQDYEAAVEEGATIVRIGSALFQ
jgi:hypothetical protein